MSFNAYYTSSLVTLVALTVDIINVLIVVTLFKQLVVSGQ